jgi:hypothetical protein
VSEDMVDETWDDDRFLNDKLLINRILDYLTRSEKFFTPKEK